MPDLTRLVSHPRETYVRQNEAKIRTSAGHHTLKKELSITIHLDAIYYCEDIADCMETIARTLEDRNKPGDLKRAEIYHHHKAQADQLKYYHLSQLADTVL